MCEHCEHYKNLYPTPFAYASRPLSSVDRRDHGCLTEEEFQQFRAHQEEVTSMSNVLRVGDTDRDRYRHHLAQMFAGGYITKEEFDERSDAVTAARTGTDLEFQVKDLPSMLTDQSYTPTFEDRTDPVTYTTDVTMPMWWVLWAVLLFAVWGVGSALYFLVA